MPVPGPGAILAVDGGGTSCRAVLDAPGMRRSVTAGPANVFSDFDAAIATLSGAFGALARAAGMSPDTLCALPAYLGLAGAVTPAIRARVAAALPLAHARVTDDRVPALRGALGTADGAVAHCGTGSFFGVQRAGAVRLAGGWGAMLGDEASAFWVGRRALRAALARADGFGLACQGVHGPQTQDPAPGDLGDPGDPGVLDARAADGLAGDGLAGIGRAGDDPLIRAVADIVGGPAEILALTARPPAAIAALAPLVTRAAEDGSGPARAILQAGADHIAGQIAAMGWRPGMALCLTGGLGPEYRPYLPPALQAALRAPLAPPIEGVVALARDFATQDGPVGPGRARGGPAETR